MATSPGPEVISLGCRLNIAESETIRGLIGRRDTIVVNSCAVTAEAVKETRKAIRRARRARPGARLIVTGCAATIDPAAFAAMGEVDAVVDNAVKLFPASWQAASRGTNGAPALAVSAEQARAFVAVQTGCDHACTFCTIPAGRGASRSEPAGAVIDRIAALVEAGKREVVLTGVDLTSYGHDLPGQPTLGMLAERILTHVTGLERLRLSSIDSIEIDDRLFALATQEARVMPHFHLSLQAGDDLILKRMRRRHLRADAVRIVERLKTARPDIAIGADLIAGFPTEDARAFANTLALIDDCRIVHGHIFPYSPRPGTPAARMPQVERTVIRMRAAQLRESAARAKAAWLRGLIGTIQRVLIEKPGTRGHTPCFADVHLAAPLPVGTVTAVRIDAATDTHLTGTPA